MLLPVFINLISRASYFDLLYSFSYAQIVKYGNSVSYNFIFSNALVEATEPVCTNSTVVIFHT